MEYRLGVGVVGGPKIVEQKLGALLDETRADELIFTSDLYEHALRLRSFGLAAGG